MRPYTPDMTKGGANASASTLNFTDWGKGKWESYRAEDGDYAGACLPFGLVRSINAPHPMQIVQSKNFLAFLHEQNTWFTKVPIDGRPFPPAAEIDPSWFGTSRGKWEGDTLVIDTVSFNGKTRLDTIGHPHSEKMSVHETWTLMNPTQVSTPSRLPIRVPIRTRSSASARSREIRMAMSTNTPARRTIRVSSKVASRCRTLKSG